MASDLNPVEHIWGILKRKVEKHKPSLTEQLKNYLKNCQNFSAEMCATLVSSICFLLSLTSNIKVDLQSIEKIFESQ